MKIQHTYNNHKEGTTKSSNKSNIYTNSQSQSKSVTPFSFPSRQISPSQRRIQESPLQIPLALAVQKLTSKNSFTNLLRPKNSAQTYQSKFSLNSLLNTSSIQQSIPWSQLQNVKNILQQFIESLYCSIQRQIYQKFNVEMKRMIVKYRETERMLKKIQQIMINHVDDIEAKERYQIKQKLYQKEIDQLNSKLSSLNKKIQMEEHKKQFQAKEKELLVRQNQRLTFNLQKYQNAILKKIELFERQQIFAEINPKSFKPYQNNYFQQKGRLPSKYSQKNTSYFFKNSDYSNLAQSYLGTSRLLNINKLNPSQSPISIKSKTQSHRPTFDRRLQLKNYQRDYQLIKRQTKQI